MALALTPADTGYQLLLLIHILAFLVAFAPAVINPLLAMHFEKAGNEETIRTWAKFAHNYTSRIGMGALVVLLLTGVAMVSTFEVFEFSQAWVSIAFLGWFVLAGVISGMIGKGERLMAAGDEAGRALVAKGGPIATVVALVVLYAMIFKPGL